MQIIENLQHANVSRAARATAREHEPDARACRRRTPIRLGLLSVGGCSGEQRAGERGDRGRNDRG